MWDKNKQTNKIQKRANPPDEKKMTNQERSSVMAIRR
jgi:hypothetical protein